MYAKTRPCTSIFYFQEPCVLAEYAPRLPGFFFRLALAPSAFFHSYFFTAMLLTHFSPSFRAPSWSSLVALSVGSASSVSVRASVHSFSGSVAAFAFPSLIAASAFAGRCSAVVGCFCAVRTVVGRCGSPRFVVSVPCVVGCTPPLGWVRPASALARLRRFRRLVLGAGGALWVR
jgi:hypothetical protein